MTDPFESCLDCDRHKDFVIDRVQMDGAWVCATCILNNRPYDDSDDPGEQRTIQSFEDGFGEEEEVEWFV